MKTNEEDVVDIWRVLDEAEEELITDHYSCTTIGSPMHDVRNRYADFATKRNPKQKRISAPRQVPTTAERVRINERKEF